MKISQVSFYLLEQKYLYLMLKETNVRKFTFLLFLLVKCHSFPQDAHFQEIILSRVSHSMLRGNQMTMGKGIPKHNGNFQLAPCVHSCLPLNLRCGKDKKTTFPWLLWKSGSTIQMHSCRIWKAEERWRLPSPCCSWDPATSQEGELQQQVGESGSQFSRGNKVGHRGSSLASAYLVW